MAIRLHNFDLISIAGEASIRSDSKYLSKDSLASKEDYYSFSDLFNWVVDDKIDIESLYEVDFYYVEIGDVSATEDISPVKLNFAERNEFNENYFCKIEKGDIIKVKAGDILISKVRPYLNKIILIDDLSSKYYYTSAFIHIRPKRSNTILFYALKSVFLERINYLCREGKGYPTLNERDLKYLKLNKSQVNSLFAHEEDLLPFINNKIKKISRLKSDIIDDKEIINRELTSHFKWNIEEFYKEKSIKKYNRGLSNIANNYDLRFSPKFHRPAGEFVMNDIKKHECRRLKEYLSEPIVLGASVSPSDFDENGDCYYISMASIKNSIVEIDDTQLLNPDFVIIEKNSNKKVKKNDIIMSRSGVAIGKFAVVDKDINAIHSDFTMRIRLKDINVLFAYYFFRSIYFQYLIEVNYKGMQNNNIFPNQIQEFLIPDLTLKEQELIASKIKIELDKNKNIRKEMFEIRKGIYDKISEAVLLSQ